MDILPYNFRTCRVIGLWYEESSQLRLKLLYSGLVGFVIVNFTLSELVELVRMHNSLTDASEVLFMAFTYVAVCLKVLNFAARRGVMRSLLDDFRSPYCRPRSPAEEAIVAGYSGFLARMFLGYLILAQSTGCVMAVVPLLGGELQLPFRAYQPLDISDPARFAVAYSLQFLALFYGILINVSLDTMAYGFMILAAEQVELNCHRIVNSTAPLKRCIEHQVLLSDAVYKIQEFFIPAVVPLFFFSLVTLCTSIFRMSQMPATSFEFVSLVMYLTCMLSQVFLYCWFGNELELKSNELTDAVYSSNWLDYAETERKNLWFVMLSTKNATKISFHGQCGLTISTFVWIAKTSYAAFNLLSRATN